MKESPELRRLVNGVLLPGFTGTRAPAWLEDELGAGLAGVVYFAPNVVDAEQVRQLSAALHRVRPGVVIAVDEEGGDVTRLEARDGLSYPGNAALGRLDDVAATAAVAQAIGWDLRRAGIDLDLAPVVDVNSSPDNPVIGVRSFGADVQLTARHSRAFVTGLQDTGVAACAKHFPGHGDTVVDSHLDLPVIGVDLATLRRRDLPPFAAAIDAGVRCVLTAHIRFPALDDRPATLSPVVLGLLRAELGFDGVVITDAVDMAAIARGVGTGPGAALALAAGADLLCIGNPADDRAELAAVRSAVLDALVAGHLAVSRLEEAHTRIAALSTWIAAAAAAAAPAGSRPPAANPVSGHEGVGLDLARRVLVTTGSVRLPGPPHVIDLRTHANQAAGRHAPRVGDTLARLAPGTTSSVLPPGGADGARAAAGLAAAAAGRPLVVVVDNPHRDREQAALLRALVSARPDAVVVATGLPAPGLHLGENVVQTFGAGGVNARAAAEVILGAQASPP